MSETFEKETVKQSLKPPVMWNVIFLNDDFTTFEFVIACLMEVFNKSEEQASMIATDIHEKGKGVVGQYTQDIALTKKEDAMGFAIKYEHPLQVLVEPVI